ncbi:hypothetical protein GF327_00345 [Candidatus Woesearchaeota archaeon]|nr:hypothetical protein [Candidatus Woesearchaeota archaeon]
MYEKILLKIEKINRLIDGAKTEGERLAAVNAKERLKEKKADKEIEYTLMNLKI